MERIVQDLKLAARRLLKDRGFAGATIATLALCLAANAAIFTIVNAVLLILGMTLACALPARRAMSTSPSVALADQ